MNRSPVIYTPKCSFDWCQKVILKVKKKKKKKKKKEKKILSAAAGNRYNQTLSS